MSVITIFTADEVAKILRCNRETVYRWVKSGRLKSHAPDGVRRAHKFTQEHIDEFLRGSNGTDVPASKTTDAPASKTAAAPAPKSSRNPNRRYAN